MAHGSDEYQTPPWLFERLAGLTGGFYLDAAARRKNALCARYITPAENGLTSAWPAPNERGPQWVWLNPPFSQSAAFAAKARAEYDLGRNIVMLVPGHRTEQAFFHAHVLGVASRIIVPRKRVAFLVRGKVQASPRTTVVAVVYHNGEREYVANHGTVIYSLDDSGFGEF